MHTVLTTTTKVHTYPTYMRGQLRDLPVEESVNTDAALLDRITGWSEGGGLQKAN